MTLKTHKDSKSRAFIFIARDNNKDTLNYMEK